MKRIVWIIGMVVILVGLVMGGLALHANAAPLQTVKAWGSSAPGTVTITGTNWTAGQAVDLYMDPPTPLPPPAQLFAYEVAVAAPGSNGVFVATFTVGPTSVEAHVIQAIQVQSGLKAWTTFMITNTSQRDPVLSDIQNTVDDPKYGVKETKKEVTDIQGTVDNIQEYVTHPYGGLIPIRDAIEKITYNTTWGLAEIKSEVKDISYNATKMEIGSGCKEVSGANAAEVVSDATHFGHASLTVYLDSMDNGDIVDVIAVIPYNYNGTNYITSFIIQEWRDAAGAGGHTLEFDTSKIVIHATGTLKVIWGYNVTYPASP